MQAATPRHFPNKQIQNNPLSTMNRPPTLAVAAQWTAWLLASLLAVSGHAACHLLTTAHADLRVTFTAGASNQFGLGLYDHEANVLRRTNEVTIVGGPAARLTLPPGTPFGEAGSSIWILPQIQNAQLPYLGTSAVGVPAAALADNSMEIRLVRVEGPGHFLLWEALGPGQFAIHMDSRDGITTADVNLIAVDAHKHHSWGFTTSGLYRITFRAAGILAGQSQPSVGAEHTFIFHLLPLRPWENWQATHWPCECNPQIIGPAADPDADGVVNVAEYAQGTSPKITDPQRRPQASIIWHNSQPYGALVFHRAKTATDILFLPVMASQWTGSPWEPMSQIHLVEDLGEVERVTMRDAQPLPAAPRRWYQLRLQMNP